uniref:Uncharacterized protein n=1 Tax=Leclercia adecarboxylata TaxID=83655 RepID=A0A482M1D3_9ENTR|nr:Hypothetical protein [Leclercia adecarboxylata]
MPEPLALAAAVPAAPLSLTAPAVARERRVSGVFCRPVRRCRESLSLLMHAEGASPCSKGRCRFPARFFLAGSK